MGGKDCVGVRVADAGFLFKLWFGRCLVVVGRSVVVVGRSIVVVGRLTNNSNY